MRSRDFKRFLRDVVIYGAIVLGLIIGTNCIVDASFVIRPGHAELARLILSGKTVARPENINERSFQMSVFDGMTKAPETLVIGSSRGMYLGRDITGYDDIYNSCVSGCCLEDYYALIETYLSRFGMFPKRVIVETSPWVFFEDNPESRWLENERYKASAVQLYEYVNSKDVSKVDVNVENPYISIPYFRYNLVKLYERQFSLYKEEARVSTDHSEAAINPDGTIRYEYMLENENDERLKNVLSEKGACSYERSNNMVEVDEEKKDAYWRLIDCMHAQGSEVIIYMQPLSVTQSEYSFDKGLNPGYKLAYNSVLNEAEKRGIEIRGSYDARDWGLTDYDFIDRMHLDKNGTSKVWNYKVEMDRTII